MVVLQAFPGLQVLFSRCKKTSIRTQTKVTSSLIWNKNRNCSCSLWIAVTPLRVTGATEYECEHVTILLTVWFLMLLVLTPLYPNHVVYCNFEIKCENCFMSLSWSLSYVRLMSVHCNCSRANWKSISATFLVACSNSMVWNPLLVYYITLIDLLDSALFKCYWTTQQYSALIIQVLH